MFKPPPAPAPPPATPQPPEAKDSGNENTFAIGFTVTDIGGGKIQLSVAVATFDVGQQVKSISGNTITVSFKPTRGGVFLE